MTPAMLYLECARRGIHLEPRGEKLHYRAPGGTFTPELRAALATHKAALMRVVAAPPADIFSDRSCPICGSHERWQWIDGRQLCRVCFVLDLAPLTLLRHGRDRMSPRPEEVASMHLNKVTLIGRIGTRGVRLTSNNQAIPICTFTLETDEPGKGGTVFTAWISVEIVGKHAEAAAESLEPGDEVLIDGRLKYRTTVDPKTQQKTSKLLMTSWIVTPSTPHMLRGAARPTPVEEGSTAP